MKLKDHTNGNLIPHKTFHIKVKQKPQPTTKSIRARNHRKAPTPPP